MRRIGGEHPSDLEAPLETPEHLVQRLDESADLVGGPGVWQAVGEVRLADASGAPHHLVDRTKRLAREQRAGEADHREDHHGHAEKEPAPDPHRGVRIVQGHRHLDGVVISADVHGQRDHPDRLLAEIGDGAEHRFTVAQAREQIRRRRKAGRAKRHASRDDMAVEIRDLNQLVKPDERRRPRRDLEDPDRRGWIGLERRLFGRRERENLVVDASEHHSAERPVSAERRERQHRREHRHVPQPEAGPEAERPHESIGSGSPSR